MTIREEVIAIIKTNFFVGKQFDLQDTQSFLEAGVIDSIGMIALVQFIEKDFNIQIEDDEFMPENLDSISGIVDYLKAKGVDS
jgi:acyl carrier protein